MRTWGLLARISLAVVLIFGLVFAFMMAVVYIFVFFGMIEGIWILVVPMCLALALVLFQYWYSPRILKGMFNIQWLSPVKGFPGPRCEHLFRRVERMAVQMGVPVPEVGVIADDSPNALTFGWSRRRAFLVVSRGVLKYCDEDEVEAIAAHELGHIAHNDFVVMTVVTAIVVMFYVVAEWCFRMIEATSDSDDDEGNPLVAALGAIAVVSFIMYLMAHFISLLISRYREYWADHFSSEATSRPNALASALVKVAYGLAIEGTGLSRKERGKHEARHANCLMIFDGKMARCLAGNSVNPGGQLSKEAIRDTMAWDLWNPWGSIYELNMTHPLPGKRIQVLCEAACDMGQVPFVEFDREQPESYWDDFLKDLLARTVWMWAIPVSIALAWYGYIGVLSAFGLMVCLAGALGLLYYRFYYYPPGFREASVEDLLRDPKASPVRGRPVIIRGRVDGLGRPGYVFAKDMRVDDGTGMLLMSPGFVFRSIETMFKDQKGLPSRNRIEARGWYRRPVMPVLELRTLTAGSEVRRYPRSTIVMSVTGFVAFVGGLIFLLGTL